MKTTQELKELLYKNKTVADQQPDAIAEAKLTYGTGEGIFAPARHGTERRG